MRMSHFGVGGGGEKDLNGNLPCRPSMKTFCEPFRLLVLKSQKQLAGILGLLDT